MRYDFSLNIITRKPKEAKHAALAWCQEHGLAEPIIRDFDDNRGWTNFAVFSSYLEKQNYVTLDDTDTQKAFRELLTALRKVDRYVHVQTDWRSLERYMTLEAENVSLLSKVTETQSALNEEEASLERSPTVYETDDFEDEEDALAVGRPKDFRGNFKTAPPPKKNRRLALVEA